MKKLLKTRKHGKSKKNSITFENEKNRINDVLNIVNFNSCARVWNFCQKIVKITYKYVEHFCYRREDNKYILVE